jgi:hypothetical protein
MHIKFQYAAGQISAMRVRAANTAYRNIYPHFLGHSDHLPENHLYLDRQPILGIKEHARESCMGRVSV